MPRKGKRRREARRERHQQAGRAAGEPGAEELPPAQVPPPERRAKARPKQRPRRAGYVRVIGWDIAVGTLVGSLVSAVVLAFIGVGVYLIASSGSSGVSAPPAATRSPDPRVAGQTPTATFSIDALGTADDSSFRPNAITAKPGQVFEIIVRNVGDVSHNLRLSGPNGAYADDPDRPNDDFVSDPDVIQAGEEGRVLAKFDKAGSFPFRCDFHPLVQIGTLVVQ
jgi:plastocyanin